MTLVSHSEFILLLSIGTHKNKCVLHTETWIAERLYEILECIFKHLHTKTE